MFYSVGKVPAPFLFVCVCVLFSVVFRLQFVSSVRVTEKSLRQQIGTFSSIGERLYGTEMSTRAYACVCLRGFLLEEWDSQRG